MQLITTINPFDRRTTTKRDIDAGLSIEELVTEFLLNANKERRVEDPLLLTDVRDHLRVTVGGNIVPQVFWETTKPRENDIVTICPVVAKGESDKQIINLAAMIAIGAFVAPMIAGGAIGGIGFSTGFKPIGMALITAGAGLAISALTPGPDRTKISQTDTERSQSYSWNPLSKQEPGIIGKWYGLNRLHPNIFSVYTSTPTPIWTTPGTGDDDGVTEHTLYFKGGLCEGPVEGPIADSYLINGQPSDNYPDVSIEFKYGTIDQTAATNFTQEKVEYFPNAKFDYTDDTSYVWTTPDDDFDELEVEILFPQGLYRVDGAGNVATRVVRYKVEVSEKDQDAYTTWFEVRHSNKMTSTCRYVYKTSETYSSVNFYTFNSITITNGKQYDIKFTRIAFSTESMLVHQIESRVGAIREVVDIGFKHPRVCYMGVSALATETLSGTFDVSVEMECSIVNVYDGASWNLEYSNNPAWVVWDILTRPVISGVGDSADPYVIERYDGISPNNLDLTKFYELAAWCDQLVDDGEGGTSKRITFNGGFDTLGDPWTAAGRVLEIARSQIYRRGDVYTLAIDKSVNYTQLLASSNIKKGSFVRTYFPANEMVSEIEVNYRDKNALFERTPITLINTSLENITRIHAYDCPGIVETCEAWRYGQYKLALVQYLKSTIELECDIDALAAVLGDRIKVQHTVPEWGIGGVVASGGAIYIIVEEDIVYTDDSGVTWEVYVRKQDGTENNLTVANDYETITGVNTGTKTFTISGDHTDEFKDGDTIRIVDSTGNDGDYTVNGDSTFGGADTSIIVDEAVPDATVDGGLYNIHRIVVTTPFLDVDDNPSAPIAGDIYAFGEVGNDVQDYRIVSLRRSSDLYFKVTAIEYNANVYGPDGSTPVLPMQAYTSPVSDKTTLQVINPPVTKAMVASMIGIDQATEKAIGVPNIDIPLVHNITWSDNDSSMATDEVAWDATDNDSGFTTPIIVVFKGESYEVDDGTTTSKFIYWDEEDTGEFKTTESLLVAIASGHWCMAVNEDGEVSEVFGRKIIHGGLIQAGTVETESILIGLHSLTSSIVLYYAFEDNDADTTVDDSSTNGYDGTLEGGDNTEDITITGHLGYGIDLNGSDDYVDTGETFQSTFRASFSVSIWIKPDDGQKGGGNHQWLWGVVDSTGDDSKCYGILRDDGVLQFAYESEGVREDAMSLDAEFADGAASSWHHVVMTMDSTVTGAGAMKIYLNGDEVELDPQYPGDTTGITHASWTSAQDVFVGAYNNDGSAAGFFDGGIDEFIIFGKALSHDEVKNLYALGNTGEVTMDDLITGTVINERGIKTGAITAGSGIIDRLAVRTLHVSDNAITVPTSAYTAGNVALGTSAVKVQELTATCSGAAVYIQFSCVCSPGIHSNITRVELFRGAVSVYVDTVSRSTYYGGGTISFGFSETPAAGSNTYSVYVTASVSGPSAYNRSMFSIETKK